jgi:UDP-N-acetylmuramate--alanine ligase
MYNLGYHIQGSDLSSNYNTERLEVLGIKVFIGHDASNIHNIDYVVISSAVKSDNPEVKEAIKNGVPVIKRASMLAELMRFKKTAIAISGSHGKTTTTSLTACMFEAAELHPTVINGGIINNKSTNAYLGNGEYVIVEADESDGTFIKIPATIGVITNIDPEHLDYYGNFENLIAAFKTFIVDLPFYGFAVACVDHKTVKDLVSTIIERKVITYGINSRDAHVRAYNIRPNAFASVFDVAINLPLKPAFIIENVTLSTPGLHNVLNSLSTIAIAAELEFDHEIIKNALKDFKGVKRRFTRVCDYNGVALIDDYAHHPAEVEATLSTARDVVKDTKGKIIAVFQPHRYTRLSNLFEDFVNCFSNADTLYVMDVYSAGEALIEGYDTKSLIEAIKKKYPNLKASYMKDEDMLEATALNASSGDLILMMGAGNITYLAANLADKLNQRNKIVA